MTGQGAKLARRATVVSSAYPQAVGLAPGMLATAYGTDLATSSGAAQIDIISGDGTNSSRVLRPPSQSD
jgi:hypothetical protein